MKRKISLKQKLTLAKKFFARELFTAQMLPHVFIDIRLERLGNFDGLCEVTGYNSKNKPREFLISINKKLSDHEKIVTLAHEMVHVKQYAYCELDEQMTKWQGRRIIRINPDYNSNPWEVEAYQREYVLFDLMMGSYDGECSFFA